MYIHAEQRDDIESSKEGVQKREAVKAFSQDFPGSAKRIRIDRGTDYERTDQVCI